MRITVLLMRFTRQAANFISTTYKIKEYQKNLNGNYLDIVLSCLSEQNKKYSVTKNDTLA